MSGNSLEERLKSNANAFDGLLSLISAKYYDNEDNKVNNKRKHSELSSENEEEEGFGEYDNQWKATKKSKEEIKENKRKKFAKDDVIKTGSVKDMMDNMEKQKLVTPAQKLRERLKQKQSQQKEESEESSKEDEIDVIFDDNGNPINENASSEAEEESKDISDNELAYEKLQKTKENTEKVHEEKKERKMKNIELLRSKLQNKISSLKQSRKAVGSNVQGALKSREELLAQRKKREELIKQRKEEAESDDDEDEDNDSSDSESDFDIDEDINADNVMYGSINFDDGSKVTSDLQRIRGKTEKAANAKKGPAKRDYKAQLRLLEKKKSKLANKDEMEQIKEIENKGWQKAMLAAEGITVRDDEKLLKKALKKKEQKKRKSAVQWQDRKQQVITTIAERTKRREENLRMRKENKGKKRKNQTKMKKSLKGKTMVKKAMENSSKKGNKKGGNNNKRAGFEGSMKRK
ncbi:ribosome biosynthesis protein [Hanseniaspora uvarum]|nr:ribosome biosynthesis protein [Hanseniaspora uvarum]